MPAAALVQCFAGLWLARSVVLPLFGVSRDTEEGRQLTVSTAFQNSGVLPLLLADSLFRSNKGVLAQFTAYESFYLTAWSPLFWFSGSNILRLV